MPTYEYRCRDCGHTFSKKFTVAEHDRYEPQCPKCKSKNVEQLISEFFAQTSKKS
ncbi:MAG: zinc ribbon domain-containing protein [Calditrichaeota bacterium]|nr:MAG: zinc ribbon domain-containing protein [Calditrichota bacterium]